MMDSFEANWRRFQRGLFPVGYLLREAQAPHWIRFHSLPESKRYAATDEERAIILARQNELATAVFGEDSACWLVQACWETPEGTIDIADIHDPFRACREHELSFSFRFLIDEGDEDEHAWNVHAGLVSWAIGRFDELLLQIAQGEAAPTLWMSPSTGSIFAPYDGGIDLFLFTRSAAEELKALYTGWISPHRSRL